MTNHEIDMCVADVMQDDEIENIESILRTLNHAYESSWRAARGSSFTAGEVTAALSRLADGGLVTPCMEERATGACRPIPVDEAKRMPDWSVLWFHLEPTGVEAIRQWWDAEGHEKYPLREEP